MSTVSIAEVTVQDLDVELVEPFGIATGAQARASNLLVRVVLDDGTVGLGEAAPFPAVNGETRERARAGVNEVREALVGWDARRWRPLGAWLRERISEAASARCAIETAVIDALARRLRVPLWVAFGGSGTVLETDCTITTGTAEAAARAAARIANDGFRTIKLKVGGVALAEDAARLEAVVRAAPGCALLLDGNAALGSVDAGVALVEAARRLGGRVVLFEQPLGKDDLAGLRELGERAACPVAADESATSAADVLRIARERAASVVNVKITKSGLVEALDMIACARAAGLGLMVGGMVETTLAMTTSACLAAGQGGFSFIDLDTPMFLRADPFEGGWVQRGAMLELGGIEAGHGLRAK